MAHLSVPEENRHIHADAEIAAFLRPVGITYERWDVGAPRVPADAEPEAILKAYEPEVEQMKRQGGYVTADVINVTPGTPNLDAMLSKFSKEHTHSEDEVRFIVKGRGIFHIHPPAGPVFAIQVEAGDMINVPAGTRHWFDVCPERSIRAIRLFKDMSGWTPAYVEGGVHEGFEPVCFGPGHVPAAVQDPRNG